MRSSLFWKLTLSFALATVIGVGGALLVAGYSTTLAFERYAHGAGLDQEGTTNVLIEYYATYGSWDGVESALQSGRGRGIGPGRLASVRLADADGHILIDPDEANVGQQASRTDIRNGIPLVVAGEQVGTLLLPGSTLLDASQSTFLTQMRNLLILSGGGALAVALVLGALLVRGITRPLDQLTAASRAIAAGELETRVPVRSKDEVGQLATAFNQMAADLSQAEEARRQQTADIAHELRTPLTIIQGHLEALADGIFPADAEHLDPVLEQTHLLNRLVEDLRTLSLADAGRLTLYPTPTDVSTWVEGVVGGFRAIAPERGVTLALNVAEELPEVQMDPARMAQVLGNLIDNALRHTPQGGRVTINVAHREARVDMSVEDTGPGVPPEQIPFLFERFWRGDPSRSRSTGGSGLGLAIAQRIVEGHGGRIWAERAPAGGLQVTVSLPVR
ncbi:MAG: HAMP domain-containing protein [Anaerolineae bacterium]|nr:HAMP domain-containing protein [Anaerolineae bacterium]